jgi:quercetin 2,3-dioxygenase
MIKTIENIIAPPTYHFVGDGFRVHNFIPSAIPMSRMNPFIMLDYNSPFVFPPSEQPPGVGVHPHRGFETVTIAYQGKVAHHDSAGNSGVIGEGEVQWMTAASGVLHKEYHEQDFARKGGTFQMVQLWVNLPAEFKMSTPRYQAITREHIKKVDLQQNGHVEIIAGQYQGIQGPASTFSPVHLINVFLKAGGNINLSFDLKDNTALLVIKGSAIVLGQHIPADHLVLFHPDGNEIHISSEEDSIILVMSAQPIEEPIAAYGPFVMNTREEIMQSYQDFQQGKFGYLED